MTRAVVMGSGPNGLAAAVRLARERASRSPVLGSCDPPGGGHTDVDADPPGDAPRRLCGLPPHEDPADPWPCTGRVVSSFLSTLGLERFGLEWLWPEIDLAHPLDDGRAGVMSGELDRTVASLGHLLVRLRVALARIWSRKPEALDLGG